MGLTLTVTLITCIDPLGVQPSDFEDLLVVQGFITDDFGPHEIRITRIARFSGVAGEGEIKIEEADVRIIDDLGELVELKRMRGQRKTLSVSTIFCSPAGLSFSEFMTDYRTPEDFKGNVGRTYTLEVVTTDGQVYRSEPQLMGHTPVIDSLHLGFKVLPGLDPIVPGSSVEVFTTWTDPEEEENFYFWRINGIYRIFTPDTTIPGVICCAYEPRDGLAEDCWIVERNLIGNRLVFSDERVNGQTITLPIGQIEDDGLRFANTAVPPSKQYHVEVEQYMIPEEAFEFNQRIQTLSEINGEIFDPPPLSIRGNIFNVDDPEELVVGYFGAYQKQTRGIFLDKSLLEFTQRFPDPCGDCRLRTGAQLETPEPYRQ